MPMRYVFIMTTASPCLHLLRVIVKLSQWPTNNCSLLCHLSNLVSGQVIFLSLFAICSILHALQSVPGTTRLLLPLPVPLNVPPIWSFLPLSYSWFITFATFNYVFKCPFVLPTLTISFNLHIPHAYSCFQSCSIWGFLLACATLVIIYN